VGLIEDLEVSEELTDKTELAAGVATMISEGITLEELTIEIKETTTIEAEEEEATKTQLIAMETTNITMILCRKAAIEEEWTEWAEDSEVTEETIESGETTEEEVLKIEEDKGSDALVRKLKVALALMLEVAEAEEATILEAAKVAASLLSSSDGN